MTAGRDYPSHHDEVDGTPRSAGTPRRRPRTR
jgi:hypothetical protein